MKYATKIPSSARRPQHVSLLDRRPRARVNPCAVLGTIALACCAPSAFAQGQVVFSVDYRSGTVAVPDSATNIQITEGDLLRAPFGIPTFGPLAAPEIVFTGQSLGINQYPACVGHLPGTPCKVEVDALSFGNDSKLTNLPPFQNQGRIYFSVDRFAVGVSGTGVPPNVRSEGAAGANEAAADVFTPYQLLIGPLPPTGLPGQNVGVFDGNGRLSSSGHEYPGLGLKEPSAGSQPPFDDIDALSMSPIPTGPGASIYYSLDGNFLDPVTGQVNSGSAQQQGVPPSAVLRRLIGTTAITIYASPAQLGLSPNLDDLDALVLADNGDGVYEPSTVYYDWLSGTTDMLLFSVRRGSAVIGQADSQFGLPIEPGDILAPPLSIGQRPRIFIAAEELGLATQRSGAVLEGDELDALAIEREPYTDCNHNGRDDAVDIGTGFSSDSNNNGIPDECEQKYTRYCLCTAGLGPCGNDDPNAGCKNSTGVGGLLTGVGTTSIATDDLQLAGSQLPPNSTGLFYMGANQAQVPFGDGLRCVASPTYRIGTQHIDPAGNVVKGPGLVGQSCSPPYPGCFAVGQTWNFQLWYRNAANFCTPATYNLTNGVSVTFTP